MRVLPEVLRKLFSRPVTLNYPKKRVEPVERTRGLPAWTKEKCIYCMLCQMNCPPQAIIVGKEKKSWSVDAGKCIFCGRCEDICPVKAIALSKNFELADPSRQKLKMEFK